jgi:CBS domain-containing protein
MSVAPARGSMSGRTADEIVVGEVMHTGIVYCPPEVPLRYAAQTMAAHHVHAVIVLGDDEEGGLWGLVSDTDVLTAVAERTLDSHTAGGMAQTPVVTVSRRHTLARAAELMQAHRVTHLVVVGATSRPIGVVSTFDLARAAAEGLIDRHSGPAHAAAGTG